MRVHLGKYRDAEDGITVRCRSDYAHSAFTVLGSDEVEATEPEAMEPEANSRSRAPPKTAKRGGYDATKAR